MIEPPNELTDLLSAYTSEVGSLTLNEREVILAAVPKAMEIIDAKARVIGYGYGTGYRDTIFTIILSKNGIKLGIVGGAELPDPSGLMEGTGKRHRYVQITEP